LQGHVNLPCRQCDDLNSEVAVAGWDNGRFTQEL